MEEDKQKRRTGWALMVVSTVLTASVTWSLIGSLRHEYFPWLSQPYVHATLAGVGLTLLAILFKAPGILALGTFAFAFLAFSLLLPWESVNNELLWDPEAKPRYPLVLFGAFAGLILLLVGGSVRVAAASLGSAALASGPVAYAYYDLTQNGAASQSEPAFGLYAAMAASVAALVTTLAWIIVALINRPQPPEMIPTFNEPFPRL